MSPLFPESTKRSIIQAIVSTTEEFLEHRFTAATLFEDRHVRFGLQLWDIATLLQPALEEHPELSSLHHVLKHFWAKLSQESQDIIVLPRGHRGDAILRDRHDPQMFLYINQDEPEDSRGNHYRNIQLRTTQVMKPGDTELQVSYMDFQEKTRAHVSSRQYEKPQTLVGYVDRGRFEEWYGTLADMRSTVKILVKEPEEENCDNVIPIASVEQARRASS